MSNMVNAAIRGGAAAMSIYNSAEPFDISLKQDQTPLIEADKMAHTAIKEYLGRTRIPILSEEGREMRFEERCNWELFWLVDPLDGTHEFIERTDEFTVNIALMESNVCVGAAIYLPCQRTLYLAGKSGGAYLWSEVEPQHDAEHEYASIAEHFKALPTHPKSERAPIVAISRLHSTEDTHRHIEELRSKYPDLKVVEQGSSYKFCMLAEGAADYYVRTSTTYEWDTAAGELILAEAGGTTMAMHDGSAFIYNKEDLENPWFVARSAHSLI